MKTVVSYMKDKETFWENKSKVYKGICKFYKFNKIFEQESFGMEESKESEWNYIPCNLMKNTIEPSFNGLL